MRRYATFDLPLHDGKAPAWLVARMKKLGRAIIDVILEEFGYRELLTRLADPLWFQALGMVLGYDWHSSGVTTVLTGVLREILTPDTGIMVAGGKGRRSLRTPEDIERIGREFGFSERRVEELKRASLLAAKVDNACVQDGHQLYHHAMFVAKDGSWVIVQQGMNPERRTARRYHWCSEGLRSFVIDPHSGIIGDGPPLPFVLNMASSHSVEAQHISVDLVNEGVQRIKNDLAELRRLATRTARIDEILSGKPLSRPSVEVKLAILPTRVNWEALKRAYELQPRSYEELIAVRGLGPQTIRALALIAELIYNAEVCWRDPIRYSFAHGGKDRVPYPVNVKRMEETADFLRRTIEEARLGHREKLDALRRLSKLLPVVREYV